MMLFSPSSIWNCSRSQPVPHLDRVGTQRFGNVVQELAQGPVDRVTRGDDGGSATLAHRLGKPAGECRLADSTAPDQEPRLFLPCQVNGGGHLDLGVNGSGGWHRQG